MNTKGVRLLLNRMGFLCDHVSMPQSGYRNRSYRAVLYDGSIINLIIYKSEPGIAKKIRSANAVSDALAELGFPTRKTLTRVVKFKENSMLFHACAYTYLPGQTLEWDGWTQKHLKLLGYVMAEVHKSISVDAFSLPNIILETQKELVEMQSYFKREPVNKAMHVKLNLDLNLRTFSFLQKNLSRFMQNDMKYCVLHMDLVRGNVLFTLPKVNTKFQIENVALSGVIDFEKVACGPAIFDLARTLAFLLVDCKYKNEEKIRKYFLESGYVKRGGLTIENRRDLAVLTLLFLLYDFYKFLVHNPYEYLERNEHFIRTRDLLISKKVLLIKP